MFGAVALGSAVKDFNDKKNSGALNAPESSLSNVELGKYSTVQNPYRAQLENNSYQQSWWDKVGNCSIGASPAESGEEGVEEDAEPESTPFKSGLMPAARCRAACEDSLL